MPTTPKKQSLSTKLYTWIRQAHYYTALPLAVMLLFLVITGIISLQDKVNPKATPPREVSTTCDIPASVSMEKDSVAHYLQEIFPGKIDKSSSGDDDTTITVYIESVWRYHTIMVDKATRKGIVKIEVHPKAQGFVDIHSGKHATKGQLILFQLLAVVIILMILSGVLLAVLRKSTKQRLISMGLLALGCIALVLLFWNR